MTAVVTNRPMPRFAASGLELGDDAQTEQYLTEKAERSPNLTRLPLALALLELRRGQPRAAVERVRALAVELPGNIEVLLTRAEIFMFAGTADASEIVQSLMARAADGLVHKCALPGEAAARVLPAPGRAHRGRRRRSSTQSSPPTERPSAAPAPTMFCRSRTRAPRRDSRGARRARARLRRRLARRADARHRSLLRVDASGGPIHAAAVAHRGRRRGDARARGLFGDTLTIGTRRRKSLVALDLGQP